MLSHRACIVGDVSHPGASPSYQPTTFLERGACVPFTTPMLAGTRVRPADRLGLELIVPNPSGGRGDYILPWTGLRSLCRPTVHDVKLTERISTLRSVTPATIRTAARQLAAEGLAGRAAGAAAQAAQAAEDENQVYTNFYLLLCLVQQGEAPGSGLPPPEQESPANLKRRAKRTIASIAPRLRQDADAIATSLEELAVLFSPIGLGQRATRSRIPHAIACLKLLRREAWALPAAGDEHVADQVQMVVSTADATLRLAEATLGETRAASSRLVRLLVNWRMDPTNVGRLLARPDWLMDGWERICRLWEVASSDAERRDALDEIVPLLPIIPKEAGEWVGFHVEFERAPRTQRLVVRHEDWRTGLCVQDTIARNEALLAA